MKRFTVFLTVLLSLLLMLSIFGATIVLAMEPEEMDQSLGIKTTGSGSYYYLSDMSDYEEGFGGVLRKNVGWGSYCQNMNPEGGKISLKMTDGSTKTFDKGIGAHAACDLIYDLGDNTTYNYLKGYFGINSTKGNNAHARIYVYASNSFSEWGNAIFDTGNINGNTQISETIRNISGCRYIRIVGDPLGANSYDHVVVGDLMVYSEGYVPSPGDETVKSYNEYTEILTEALSTSTDYSSLLESATTKEALMKRMFIEKFGSGETGYRNLIDGFLNGKKGERHRALIEYLFSDSEALEELLTGGNPDRGSYLDAMDTLSLLYEKYKDDLNNTEALYTNTPHDPSRTKGDVYRTLMFSLALSADVHSWLDGGAATIDMIERYKEFKKVYTDPIYHVRYEVFENLCLEEMRYLTNNRIWNDEIYWANGFCRTKTGKDTASNITISDTYWPHRYLHYGKDWDYYTKGYVTPEGYNKFNEKYMLAQFGMTSYTTTPRIWMVFEGSHICWGISHVGSNLCAAFGVPAHYGLQPNHAVYFHIDLNSEGDFLWSLGNNISGWTQSCITGSEVAAGGSGRMLCDWGTMSQGWISGWNGSYILLSQYALDHQDKYEDAELLMSLASYANTFAEKKALYEEVLEIMPYHLEAWHDLIVLCNNEGSVTAEDMMNMANEVAEDMKYFPLPMHDLINLIKNGLGNKTDTTTKTVLISDLVMMERDYLNQATKANTTAPSDQNQKDVAVTMANYLLGNGSNIIATFSFSDGFKVDEGAFGVEKISANKIYFNKTYKNATVRYSLDGGKSWSENCYLNNNLYVDISDQIEEISADNDILIWMVGWGSSLPDNAPEASKAYRININAGSAVNASALEANDNENRFFGTTAGMEYFSSSTDGKWHNLDTTTVFEGTQTVPVRVKATGQNVAGPVYNYKFTENNTTNRSYIPINRLSLVDFSSEETNRERNDAAYAIDGLLSTLWHTSWTNNSDLQRYITVRLDEPTYLSGVDYTPRRGAGNGTFYSCTVYVSMDGVNWYLGGTGTGWGNDTTVKHVNFTSPVYGQYVKVCGTSTVGNFGSAASIEFFEDTTIKNKVIIGAKITSNPTKKNYMQGEKIDLTGLSVSCVYADGSSTVVPNTMLTVDSDVFNHTGTIDVSISYLNMLVGSYQVEVSANTRTATSITIEKAPLVTKYFAGQPLNLTGLVVKASDGNGSWYPTDYTVTPDGALNYGTTEITVNYQEKTATFNVTIEKEPKSLSVTLSSASDLMIGDRFDPSGLHAVLTYMDDTTEELSYLDGDYSIKFERIIGVNKYYLDINYLTVLPGTKKLVCVLNGNEDIAAEIETEITVLNTLREEDFYYEVDESNNMETECSTYSCYLSCYTNTQSSTLSVPAEVILNDVTYKVIGVRTGAFANANQITELSLPGTIQHLEPESLSALTDLKELYLTGIADIDNLTIDDCALPDGSEGTIYMSDEELSEDLSEKLNDYQGNPDSKFSLTSGKITADMIADTVLTEPSKQKYELNEAMDYSGMELKVTLKNGIVLPLGTHQYTISNGVNDIYGKRDITLSIKDTEITKSYSVEVITTAPFILSHPHDQYWLAETMPSPDPLVITVDGNQDNLHYIWYMSSDAVFSTIDDKDNGIVADTIVGTDTNQYTPAATGYYYAVVYRTDRENNRSDSMQTMTAHVKLEVYPVYNQTKDKRYPTLVACFNAADSEDTIMVERDISVEAAITLNKDIKLVGKDNTVRVTRAQGYTGNVFVVSTGGKLTIENLIFDGENINNAGSCIMISGTGELILNEGATLRYFRTGSGGYGAVHLNDTASVPKVTVNTGALIENCYAGYGGGAIGVFRMGKILINGGSFIHNSANYGGAVFLNSGVADKVVINGGLFENNNATLGGALMVGGPSASEINGGTFKNNSGTSGGGTIHYYNGGSHAITGGTFIYSGSGFMGTRNNPTIAISGGSFSTNPSYIASNCISSLVGNMYFVYPQNQAFWVTGITENDEDSITINFAGELSGKIYATAYDNSGKPLFIKQNVLENASSTMFNISQADSVKFFITDTNNKPVYLPYTWEK